MVLEPRTPRDSSSVRCCWMAPAVKGLQPDPGLVHASRCWPAGRDPDRPAIVWADEAAPHVLHSMSLGQLATRSAHVADALRALGLKPGELLQTQTLPRCPASGSCQSPGTPHHLYPSGARPRRRCCGH